MERLLSSVDYLMCGLGWSVYDHARLNVDLVSVGDDLAAASRDYPELVRSFVGVRVALAGRRDRDRPDSCLLYTSDAADE